MRKVWLFIGSVLLLNSATYSAFGVPNHHFSSPKIIQQRNPPKEDPEPNLDGLVEVSFKIDADGKVQIQTINSTSPQLADYVIKKLGKVKLEQGSSQAGKVIKYSFVFKKQA